MNTSVKQSVLAVVGVGAVALATGCAATLTATTRPSLGEMTGLTSEIVESIATAPAIEQRTVSSQPIVLSVDSVENRSSDVFTKAEQWYLMQSVARRVANPTGMGAAKNIRFVLPPDAIRHIERRGSVWEGLATDRQPTHELTGYFSSITRAGAEDRRDFFEFAYQIVDLRTGQIVVDTAVDIEKSAAGRLFN